MSEITATPDLDPSRPRRRSLHARTNQWRYQQIQFNHNRRGGMAPVLRKWHQRAGLFACVFMIWLGASGFALNQSADWGLDAIRLDASWLMNMYGLHPEPPKTGYYADQNWLAQTSERTILNGMPLQEMIPSPLGMAAGGTSATPLLFIASSDRVVVVTPQGARVDELRDYTLPVSAIRRIGSLPSGEVAIQDLDIYVTTDGLDWRELPLGTPVSWSSPERLQPQMQNQVLPFARPTMALEQVLIDAHSGRLFGGAGPLVINTVGIAAIFLGISGIWIYWSTARRRRQRAS